MKLSILAIFIGFILDCLLGDPYTWPHPVRWIGALISKLETFLRRLLPKTKTGQLWGGGLLVFFVAGISFGLCWVLLFFCRRVHWALALAVESVCCYYLLAARCLKDESMKVYAQLQKGDLPAARQAVSMIVGRDTAALDDIGIAKAAVETVAENTSDGVIAPLFYIALGGAPLGFFYKAVNTMDSMVGYKNDKYLYFGRAAAKLDDIVNYIPARLSGWIMAAFAFAAGLNSKSALHIFLRDRRCHASPNSAQTEAACAGALQVQLAGDAVYFGKLLHKPTIGDPVRPVEYQDIPRANRLMYVTTVVSLFLFAAAKWMAFLLLTK